MKAIKDSVHGHVRLGGVAGELIDTPAFQRLRHIKQLSTVRLVYPSANHTRFEHSLGVYHLARGAIRESASTPTPPTTSARPRCSTTSATAPTGTRPKGSSGGRRAATTTTSNGS